MVLTETAMIKENGRSSARSRSTQTAERIIDAAERLYGTHGPDAVSMRQVMQEARASNKSAIVYHFGDRDNLLRAVWERRLPSIEIARSQMLAEAAMHGRDTDPFTVMQILVLPSYEPVDADGFHRYAAFMNQMMQWTAGITTRLGLMATTPSSGIAIELMRRQCPHLSRQIFYQRLAATTGLFFRQVSERDRTVAEGVSVTPEEIFLAETIGVATAGMMVAPADPRRLLTRKVVK